MKRYTIGAVFSPDFTHVLLIEKQRPAWQKGRFNFPGGHIEEGETPAECVSREFKEETNLDIPPSDWIHIGRINNEGNYYVEFLTTVHKTEHGLKQSMTDEDCQWRQVKDLPENVISNIAWLIHFAINVLTQGNHDVLRFGQFEYKYEKETV